MQQLLASDSVLTIRSNKTVWRVLQDDDDGDDLVLATEHRTPRKGKPNLIDQKYVSLFGKCFIMCVLGGGGGGEGGGASPYFY